MQYLPFIFLLQAVSIILVEKLLTKFPRVAGKIERFYGTIVEEALFGKDPDVAEDFQDDKCNVEVIARRRRRNEVCNSLKRSSVIHNAYILKNIVEIIILAFYIPFNIYFTMDSSQNLQASQCVINIIEFPQLGLHEKGQVFFNCEGKKVFFFLRLAYIQIAALCIVLFCSVCSITWCVWFRNISKLLEKIAKFHEAKMEKRELSKGSGLEMNEIENKLVEEDSWDLDIDVEDTGKDFLFLFDLLAHTAGIESTLRVLTHSDDCFRKICLPKLKTSDENIKVFEDKLRIKWKPASLETWLKNNHHKNIAVDSYDVTIFPAESSNNSVTKHTSEKDANDNYSTTFVDLQGGKTEYIVTIACVIGKSRMKGARIVTTLLPHGPERPRGGKITKSIETNEVEIAWEPPKGGFTKYVLFVDNNLQSNNPVTRYSTRIYKNSDIGSTSTLGTSSKDFWEKDISSLLTSHKITGLSPGDIYGITLMTKTGERFCAQENSIFEKVLTAPQPVTKFFTEEVDCTSAVLQWVKPEKFHAKLRAFNLIMSSNDGRYKGGDGFAVKSDSDKNIGSYKFNSIQPATEYKVVIRTVCVFEALRTVSEDVELSFCTLPEAPTNLALSYSLPNSLTVKWDLPPSVQNPTSHKYKGRFQKIEKRKNGIFQKGQGGWVKKFMLSIIFFFITGNDLKMQTFEN